MADGNSHCSADSFMDVVIIFCLQRGPRCLWYRINIFLCRDQGTSYIFVGTLFCGAICLVCFLFPRSSFNMVVSMLALMFTSTHTNHTLHV